MRTILIALLIVFSSSAFSSNTSGIAVGEQAPQIQVEDIKGQRFDLKESLANGPVVLVFYRGGWCPYCNRQLRKLQRNVVPKLTQYNAKLVAISVDKLTEAAKTEKNENLGMTIVSDPMAALVKKYKVVNQTSNRLVRTYKQLYDIDIEGASGQKHHIIAIPSVFTIAQDGKVVFAYVNEDYTTRALNRDILASLNGL